MTGKFYFLRWMWVLLFLHSRFAMAQSVSGEVQDVLNKIDAFPLNAQPQQALTLLDSVIAKRGSNVIDLSYLYAYKSGIHAMRDSLLLSKKALDESLAYAAKTPSKEAKAIALRAKAYLNNKLGLPDEVVREAKEGLKLLENSNTDFKTKYFLNYLLYTTYSKWGNEEMMEKYIKECERYALQLANPNLQVNTYNGFSTVFLTKLKSSGDKKYADSSITYLKKSFALHEKFPKEVTVNSFTVTCINIANYFLEHSNKPFAERKAEAFKYLDITEQELTKNYPASDMWINIFGIRSDFAFEEKNIALAEQYLLQGLARIQNKIPPVMLDAQYNVYKRLATLSSQKGDFSIALSYQQKAESILKKIFDQRQIFNSQKLEVQYETDKKNQELNLLRERAAARKRQNYLYAGIAIIALFGLIFMFRSYHFRLRYSIEQEKKMAHEKEEAAHNSLMLLKLEKEEQARLRAEQELLELKQQQLQKEVLANALVIDHKNEMLKQIHAKIQQGTPKDIQKLLKEEVNMDADFDELKLQIQELHPNFFALLNEKATKKLTQLDLRYATYIYMQLSTRQIAQLLHIEEQSVRMFKYRLKQKFQLDKDQDLDNFLQQFGAIQS